jgi:hypothetical protein
MQNHDSIAIGLGIQQAKAEDIPLLKLRRGEQSPVNVSKWRHLKLSDAATCRWIHLEHRPANPVPRERHGAYISIDHRNEKPGERQTRRGIPNNETALGKCYISRRPMRRK